MIDNITGITSEPAHSIPHVWKRATWAKHTRQKPTVDPILAATSLYLSTLDGCRLSTTGNDCAHLLQGAAGVESFALPVAVEADVPELDLLLHVPNQTLGVRQVLHIRDEEPGKNPKHGKGRFRRRENLHQTCSHLSVAKNPTDVVTSTEQC